MATFKYKNGNTWYPVSSDGIHSMTFNSTGNVSISNNVTGTPACTVSMTTNSNNTIATPSFTFSNLRGATGDPGGTGSTGTSNTCLTSVCLSRTSDITIVSSTSSNPSTSTRLAMSTSAYFYNSEYASLLTFNTTTGWIGVTSSAYVLTSFNFGFSTTADSQTLLVGIGYGSTNPSYWRVSSNYRYNSNATYSLSGEKFDASEYSLTYYSLCASYTGTSAITAKANSTYFTVSVMMV